ncbi:haloalkane dehalogenase [Cedecea neteri]|uniref:haloalkane dehalogenase n=1 Tax=Cedecea neteri TaxID=158822 RepID=UPI002AA90F6F|nr:haloalkane dehalogenase [Cedecea neteri]WPU20961.1 haloalkane dehalogenase [Cedecea neteri]
MPAISVLDSIIHYEERGVGTPLVFLHGNPTTSYLWRNIMPAIDGQFHCYAPDLIGMGQSGSSSSGYGFSAHARYLDAWLNTLNLQDIILVGHDWGAALAFDWASRHPGHVKGVIFMEAVLKPMAWQSLPPPVAERFKALRTPLGEKIVLEDHDFIEKTLRATVLSTLSDKDIQAYTAPYTTPESRRPLLEWARAMPFDGEPAEVLKHIQCFNQWLANSEETPKLLLSFEDATGSLAINQEAVAWCRQHIANLTITPCGPAKHNAPEDRPEEIAAAINHWLNGYKSL